ncbi:mechanosensitive ion channel [Thalassobacillus sp. B23F22_16]|uniref:mechanosensitive ion channel n=1 Tax=Thalassobacillus sp. B23F22_16 TaxID=3459513 RepID=UPI00373EC080
MNNVQWSGFLEGIPNLIVALLVLLIGWIIAKAIEKGVKKGLEKTDLDDKLFSGGKERRNDNKKWTSEKIISKVVYWIVLIFVFVIFFNILNLDIIAAPLSDMLSTLFAAIPNILKAALILLVAWLVAKALSWLVIKAGEKFDLGHKMERFGLAEDEHSSNRGIQSAANIVFYLVLLLFLPAVLAALQITGISEPFTNMIQSFLAFIPKLFAAALILLIGWFVAKLVRDILTKFLKSIGTERAAHRMGLDKVLEGTSLSRIIGTIVYILILIPVVISALEQLEIRGITDPAINMLNNVLAMIPNIAIAIVLILAGIWVGKWVGQIVANLLERLGVNSMARNMGIGNWDPNESSYSISRIIGRIVQILIVVLFTVEALQIIQLEFLVDLATGVIAYLPSVFAAIVILFVGLYVGNLVQKLLHNILHGPGYRMLSAIAKYAIFALAVFMALDQLGVADSIVNAAFILILGGLAIAFGLSFGLGGRELAAKYLHKWDTKLEKIEVQNQNKSKYDQTGNDMQNRPNRPDTDPNNPFNGPDNKL